MAGRRKKGHHAEGHNNSERWLLTYADLITLLMVFFVVMFAMSRADTAKFSKLSASLQQAFRVEVLRGNNPTSLYGDDGATALTTVLQEAIAQPVYTLPDARLVSTVSELRQAMLQLPQPPQTQANVEIGATRDGLVISLSGSALFDSGRADLKADGVPLLDTLAERLRDLPNEIRVEGHTDNIPITTSLYPSNWELSSARATTVARRMVEYGGLTPRQIIAAGFGENRPAAPNETREGRTRNRRVDIVVVSPGSPVPGTASAALSDQGRAH